MSLSTLAASGGSTVGASNVVNDLGVTNGLFTVTLDPGANVFTGAARWLDIAVRPAGVATFTSLTPRQPITPAPYALTALRALARIAHPHVVPLLDYLPLGPAIVLPWMSGGSLAARMRAETLALPRPAGSSR